MEGNTETFDSSRDEFSNLLFSDKATKVNVWLELVIQGLQPFSFVQNETIRKNVNFDTICVKNLPSYMENLTKSVEMKILRRLP